MSATQYTLISEKKKIIRRNKIAYELPLNARMNIFSRHRLLKKYEFYFFLLMGSFLNLYSGRRSVLVIMAFKVKEKNTQE